MDSSICGKFASMDLQTNNKYSKNVEEIIDKLGQVKLQPNNNGITKKPVRRIKKCGNVTLKKENSCKDIVLVCDYDEKYKNDPNMIFVGKKGTPGKYFVGRSGNKYFHIEIEK